MKKEEIHLSDWLRILVGEVPGVFYIEILLRVAVVYFILVGAMRLMGRRMSSRLSRGEMAAMVSLAAAIGVPILDPQRGLLPAVIIGLVVVGVQRLVSWWSSRNEKFEGVAQDIVSTLVENSVLQIDNMRGSEMTRELLFAQLRSSRVKHLGVVKRLYIEANGAFTLVRYPEPQPGLSILPPWDTDYVEEQKKVEGHNVCYNCGHPQPTGAKMKEACPNCQRQIWVQAIQ
ncbi:DUF421 domain-containing protein [Larkinella soli]|uniref:DUF421 domain-containing protein n=1 Tax=Larkinella soli TaxID=1770527 RepID=UPI000FFC0A8C|nr:YetF domain-containing protein [Larkinella soli]